MHRLYAPAQLQATRSGRGFLRRQRLRHLPALLGILDPGLVEEADTPDPLRREEVDERRPGRLVADVPQPDLDGDVDHGRVGRDDTVLVRPLGPEHDLEPGARS